ncbi:MAG: L-fuculose-phosphate aldolase [Micromonosporaceae bacterium]|jgi:L-fuculose-phosphate aldolase|nr:L-fuculose-phosphate aldolase [Micromonosporaceae bacterium]
MEEFDLRFRVAAARRILHREECRSGLFGAVTARIPGGTTVWASTMTYGDETRPDDVVEVPLGATVDDLPDGVSPAVAVQLAIYAARPDVGAVVHTHSHYVSVISTTGRPIGMYNELSTMYHDEQVCVSDDGDRSPAACERTATALGAKRVLLLKGHGLIAVAPSIEDATIDALALEKAARWDLAARPYGGEEIVPAHLRQTRPLYDLYFRPNMWAANLRRLRRSDPDLFPR